MASDQQQQQPSHDHLRSAATLFVGNLCTVSDENFLRRLFSCYGTVRDVKLSSPSAHIHGVTPHNLEEPPQPSEADPNRHAFVTMEHVDDADCAIASLHMRYCMARGVPVIVLYAKASPNVSVYGRRVGQAYREAVSAQPPQQPVPVALETLDESFPRSQVPPPPQPIQFPPPGFPSAVAAPVGPSGMGGPMMMMPGMTPPVPLTDFGGAATMGPPSQQQQQQPTAGEQFQHQHHHHHHNQGFRGGGGNRGGGGRGGNRGGGGHHHHNNNNNNHNRHHQQHQHPNNEEYQVQGGQVQGGFHRGGGENSSWPQGPPGHQPQHGGYPPRRN